MIVVSSANSGAARTANRSGPIEAVQSLLSLMGMVLLLVTMAAMVTGAALTLPLALLVQKLVGRTREEGRRGWQAVTA